MAKIDLNNVKSTLRNANEHSFWKNYERVTNCFIQGSAFLHYCIVTSFLSNFRLRSDLKIYAWQFFQIYTMIIVCSKMSVNTATTRTLISFTILNVKWQNELSLPLIWNWMIITKSAIDGTTFVYYMIQNNSKAFMNGAFWNKEKDSLTLMPSHEKLIRWKRTQLTQHFF